MPAIEAAYTKFADTLDNDLQLAQALADHPTVERLIERRTINDSAYFLLIWGQFEAKLNEVAEAATRNRRSDPSWERRRAWDSFNPDDMRRTKLEDRLGLVLDRDGPRGKGFRRAVQLYGERNKVAHGTGLAFGINVPAIVAELYQIISEMRP